MCPPCKHTHASIFHFYSPPPSLSHSSIISVNESDENSGISTEMLILAILIPAIVLLLIVITIIVIIKINSSSKRTKPPPPNSPFINDIEEYASIKLSPSDPTFTITTIPPVPRSPRPKTKPQGASNEKNFSRAEEDPTYFVLEDPTGGGDRNQYSLDPVDPTQVFGEPRLDSSGASRLTEPHGRDLSATDGQERVYFELENPQNSSIIKNRNPTYESIHSSRGYYWNEGLGPDQPKLTASSAARAHVGPQRVSESSSAATGPTPPTGAATAAVYLELTSPSSAK